MLKVILSWLTACILALNTATTALAQSPQVPRFEPTDCPFAIPRDETIRCGFLIVPEDRSLNGGPAIQIGVAIVASHSPHPAPDPIFFLNGGPGGSMTILFPDLFLTFKPYLTTRDVVLFDQRGAGWSQPALNCPETASLEMDKVLGKRPGPEEALKPYLACRDRLIDAGVNLPAYNTIENAADVKDLRDALGYDRINLLGVSYGTLLGQVLARDYPHMIRSAILDSAYPLWESVMADSGASMMHYFDTVFANCAADTICRTLYPDLPKVFAELFERLARAPLTVSDQNPLTGQTYTFTLDNMLLIQLLVHASPDEVPALLSDLRDGDFELALQIQHAAIGAVAANRAPLSLGMKSSIMCSLSMAYATPDQLQQSAAQYPAAIWTNARVATDMAICSQWPHHGIDPRDRMPYSTDVPMLVIGGEYDQGSSPAYAAAIAARSSHGAFAIVPNAGHGVLVDLSGCVASLELAFIDNPLHPLDQICLATIPHTNFSIGAAATRLPVWIASIVLAGLLAWSIRRGVIGLRQNGRRWTWPISLRLIGPWLPIIDVIAIGFILIARPVELPPLEPARVIATLVPLMAGIHAALLFSPEDEPALEVTAACSRPLAWTILERVTLALTLHAGIALAGTVITTNMTGEALGVAVARWLAPLLAFSGLGLCLTLINRQVVVSVGLIVLLWFGMLWTGEALVARWPFLWPIGFYVQPSLWNFGLNRLFLSLAGLGLILFATTRLLRDEERLLLGTSRARRSKRILGKGQL